MAAASPDPSPGPPIAAPIGPPIALVGMMGAGKTTIGRALAARLGWRFRDTDFEVEREAGCTIAELFARDGEAAFRAMEHHALARMLDGSALVLATGGGAVLEARNRELLRRRALTIWLDAAPATLARRVSELSKRPLLEGADPEARLTELLAERRPLYAEAQLRIDTERCDEAAVLDLVLKALADGQNKPEG